MGLSNYLYKGSDHLIDGVSSEQAITQGSLLRDQLVKQYRDEARSLKNDCIFVYSLHGELIRKTK
jgi:hypothetical protein